MVSTLVQTEKLTPSARRKLILALAWPAVLEMMLHMMVGIVDTAMAGHLGPEALSAVGLGNQIYFSCVFIFESVGIGASAIVARYIGARNRERAGVIASQTFTLGIIIGGVLSLLGYIFSPSIMGVFHLTPEVRNLSIDYLRTLSYGWGFMLLLFINTAMLRGAGNTRLPMILAAFANILNIFFNYALIFGKFGMPALGVTGAAWGTVISQSIGSIVLIFLLFKGSLNFKITLNHMHYNFLTTTRILRVGLPTAVEESILSTGNLISSYFLTHLGTEYFAAHQVANRVESLSYMPGFGFALASAALVGQSLGAKNPAEAEANIWETVKLAVLSMSLMGVFFFLSAPHLVKIFSTDITVKSSGATCLRIAALEQPFLSFVMVLLGALRGSGATTSALMVSALGIFGVRIPLFYLVIFKWQLGLTFVWWAMIVDWAVRSLIIFIIIRKGKWKSKKV